MPNHPATIRALTSAHRELRDLSDVALDAISGMSPLHAGLIDLHRSATESISRAFYDEADLLTAGTSLVLARPAVLERWGRIVLYLPERLTRSETRFTQALVAHADVTVIAGLTGDARADAAVGLILSKLGGGTSHAASTPRTATQVIHASDSDDEVRRIVRELIDAIGSVPAHRIAVLYSGDVPYGRLVHEQLSAAGITYNGRGTKSVAERSLSRGLLGILALSDELPRVDLFRAMAEASIRRPDGSTIPLSSWERVSRLAGVVRGSDWDDRLDRFIRAERATIADQHKSDAPQTGRIENSRRQIETAGDLKAFVRVIRRRIADADGRSSWSELSSWALELFHDLYGQDEDLDRLPADEKYAAAAIDRTLRGFSGLDAFGITSSREQLHDLLQLELEGSLPRVGRFGEGVFVGPISAAVGLDVDLVVVAGLAEDAYPGHPREDALLGADVRQRSDELRMSSDRLDAKRRHLLAAFASAPRVIATFPRGDLRRSTERLPSRWLLPTLRALTGRTDLVAVDWDRHPAVGIVAVRSHASELLTTPWPATEQEWRTRAISAGATLDDSVADAAALMNSSRTSADFTRFDGNLAGVAGLPEFATQERRVSPTALETYASCPHSYFVGRMLHVEPLEQPEEIITISAMDVGNLVHESMDEFIRDQADALPSFGEPWTDRQRSRLREIATARADDFVARGATGHPLLWEQERAAVLADLETMLTDDNAWRRERDARVVASELTFGMKGAEPVAIDIEHGRVLMVGSADKVDETRDGVLLITDIKTGSARTFQALTDDPVAAGTKLQLPVYAHAARQLLSGTDVEAQYWFVRKDRGLRIQLRLDDDLEKRYAATLGVLVNSIAAGNFPAKAPENPDFSWVQCRYCNPDGLGHGAARERWERKRFDPVLDSLVALIDPDAAAERGDPE